MSEIKGQILGVVLVIGIFGIVAGALIPVFRNLTNKVGTEIGKVEEDLGYTPVPEEDPSEQGGTAVVDPNKGDLTF